MKILFGIQATGNGHISRSTEIYKLLKQHPDVTQLDVLISGGKAKMGLPFEVNYEYKGLSFYYGKKGKISVLKSIGKAGFLSIAVALWKVPFREYDLVISDFEPITLWGAKIAGVKRVGIGNMYSMSSKKFPKTKGRRITNMIAKMMCPTKNKIAMHFQKFDDFIYYPIIRSEIRDVVPADKNFTLVYLNSFSDTELINCFTQDSFTNRKFVIYSKEATHSFTYQNCEVKPLNNETFIQDIANCSGVITAGGFQTISEALYLGKKLFVIPIKKQSEQISNARILSDMGVTTSMELNATEISTWLNNPNTVHMKFDDDLPNIIDAILNAPHTPKRQRKAA
ncbi:MAG TPA: glycosyltransferase family protein [Chitinophagales bacterium]|nr:glycosyltransferase family protein [Chitinophagales bacterium]